MGYEKEIHEAALALGGEVADLLQPVRKLQAQTESLGQELVELRVTEEKRRNELVQQVAAGKLAPADIPAKLTFDWVLDSPASMVLVHANVSLHANATRVAREAAPAIFEALQRRVAGVVAESVKRSVELPRGVDSEQKALRARNGDRSALEVWERLRELIDTWTACHELVRVMQRASWIPGPAHPRDRDGARVYERYEKPLLLPPGYWDRTAAELRLGVAQAAGAGPALIDWETAVQRFERLDRRQRDYRPLQVTQTINSMGNLVAEDRGPETASEFAPVARRP